MSPERPHHPAAETPGHPSWLASVKPVVPDHELLRRIGGGSYGDVWLARTTVGTWRAVKVVFRDRFLDSRPYEREFNGIQKFEPLSRSNEGFVDILQIGRNDAEGYFYYVMELADDAVSPVFQPARLGEAEPRAASESPTGKSAIQPDIYVPKTLSKVLLQRGRLPVTECLELGLTLNLGLAHLHRAGLIHRDIKPSNIIFVGGVPKLADIGLVIEVAEARSYVGTEGFIPPEGPNSPQADLYSLGKVLYEAGMGKDRKDFPEPYTQIAEAPDSDQLLEFNAILLKACAASVSERYQSAEEMNADLALLQSGGSVRGRHQFNRQFRIAKQVGAAAIAATLVIGVAWIWQRQQTEKVTHLAEEKSLLANENKRLAAEAQNNERATRQNLYAADINLAHQALLANNRTQVRVLLQNHVPKPGEPDLRGFEWRYLWEQSRSEQLFSLTGHTNEGRAVAFSPDGQYLASGCADGTTKFTALDTRLEIASLNATGEVKSISFCANRDLLAVVTKNASSLRDTRSLKPIREIPEYGWFSPDGRFLLTDAKAPLLVSGTMFTCRMVLWDMESGTVTNTLELPEAWKHLWMGEPIPWGAFAPNGKFVAIIFADAIRVFSIPDFLEVGVLARRLIAGQSSSVFVAFSPDNNTLAASEPTGRGIQLWDVAQQREGKALPGHAEGVRAVSFSPDGSLLASCGEDQTIKLWDVNTGKLVRSFRGKADYVAFSPNGNLLASVRSSDGVVDVWDVTAKPQQEFFREPLGPLGFSLQSGLVALNKDLRPLVIDPATLQVTNFSGLNLTNSRPSPYRTPEITSKHATNTERWYDPYLGNLSRDGRTVALFDLWEQSMDLWDMQDGKLLCTVEASRPWVSFAPKRQLVATAVGNFTNVTVWQLPSGTRKWVFPAGFWQALAFSPDESLVISDEGKQKKLWRIEGDEVKPMLTFAPTPNGSDGMAFSPDGRLVATGESGGPIKLWEMPLAREVGVFRGHTRSVLALAFSPDGRTLASMCDDRTVRLWHVTTRRELLRFQAPKDDHYFFNLAFSPDGRALAARRVDDEGPITWLWYAPTLGDIGSKQAAD